MPVRFPWITLDINSLDITDALGFDDFFGVSAQDMQDTSPGSDTGGIAGMCVLCALLCFSWCSAVECGM